MTEESTGDWILDATNEIVAETAAQTKSGGVHLTRHAMHVDRIIREHSKRVSFVSDEKLRRVVEDVHASLCEEVENLMDAKEGTPRAARLALWAGHVSAIEDVLYAKDFPQ